jgi:hypothetical protein
MLSVLNGGGGGAAGSDVHDTLATSIAIPIAIIP